LKWETITLQSIGARNNYVTVKFIQNGKTTTARFNWQNAETTLNITIKTPLNSFICTLRPSAKNTWHSKTHNKMSCSRSLLTFMSH